MFRQQDIKQHSDALIDLLAAQCGDLEKLLSLAREETAAVEKRDFEQIFSIVSERATVGERLEIFQKQVAELRARLSDGDNMFLQNPIVEKTNRLIFEIMAQDNLNRPLLESAKTEAATELNQLDSSQRRSNAYSNQMTKGIAYSKTI